MRPDDINICNSGVLTFINGNSLSSEGRLQNGNSVQKMVTQKVQSKKNQAVWNQLSTEKRILAA